VIANSGLVAARLGESTPPSSNRDFATLELMNALLGSGGTWDTRLMTALRMDRPLAVSASSSLESDRYRGVWNFRVSAAPAKIDAAVAVLRSQLERLQRDPVGPFELDRVKIKTLAAAAVAEEATSAISARVQEIGTDGLALDDDTTRAARYAAIDGAAVLRAAQTYLHPDDLVEIYEGPHA
jgi:predicted Zn-dependent peptidase